MEFVRVMNVGKAQLENRNSAKAIEAYTTAVRIEPKSTPALRNLARAQMLGNKNEEALKQLSRVRGLEKESAATSYLTGLAYEHLAQFENAIPFLEEAVRLDEFTPALRFQLASAYQMARRPDQALTQLRETVRLDPLHASAHFKLAALAAQASDRAEYREAAGGVLAFAKTVPRRHAHARGAGALCPHPAGARAGAGPASRRGNQSAVRGRARRSLF